MRNAAGQRLALEINTTTGSTIREQVEHTIQQHLRQVGIELTILNFPPRVLFAEITGRPKFKALAMYAWVFSPTSGCEFVYASDMIPNEANGWAGRNYPGYKNAEMDRACKEAAGEVDETKRNVLLNDSARIFSRDLPALPLYYRAGAAVAKIGLQNFTIDNLSGDTYETWNAHRWFWKGGGPDMLRVIHAYTIKPGVDERSFVEWLDGRLDEVTRRFGCVGRKTWVFLDGLLGRRGSREQIPQVAAVGRRRRTPHAQRWRAQVPLQTGRHYPVPADGAKVLSHPPLKTRKPPAEYVMWMLYS